MLDEANWIALKPFPGLHEDIVSRIQISALAERIQEDGWLHFKIIPDDSSHDFKIILFSTATTHPKRKNELWKETCFECFIPSPSSASYQELNVSPNGNWNLYSFTAERTNMAEVVLKLDQQGPKLTHSKNIWSIQLPVMKLPDQIGVTAVIQVQCLKTQTVVNTYWAFEHHGSKPDFHRRDSFKFPVIQKEGSKI